MMTTLSEIVCKFKSLRLYCNEDLMKAYMGKIKTLEYAINKLPQKIDLEEYTSSDICSHTTILLEYIAVMTIGLADILAGILNDGFKLSIKTVYFKNIHANLSDNPIQKELANKIANIINEIIESKEWKYISALDNYVKHNSILKINVNYNFEKGKEGITNPITEFCYKENLYSSITMNDFLDKSYTVIKNLKSIMLLIMEY